MFAEKRRRSRSDSNSIARLGVAEVAISAGTLTTAIGELDRAEFKVRLSDLRRAGVDYLAPIEIEFGGRRTFTGLVLRARPEAGEVEFECASGVALTENLMPVMAAEEFQAIDVVYAAARSAGFSEENIEIHGLEDLPVEPIEIVIAIRGLEVQGKRRVGRVVFLPPDSGRRAFEAFDTLPDPIGAGVDGADCFAVVIETTARLWDAEIVGLREAELALAWLSTRARYGLALLPDGQPQNYEREIARGLPRVGTAIAVRAMGSARRWVRDPADLTARRSNLPLNDDAGQLWPAMGPCREAADQLALLAAVRAFEGDPLQRVSGLWEALEFYAGDDEPSLFESDELDRLRDGLPQWLNEGQKGRIGELLNLANQLPLRRRLVSAFRRDGVPITEAEMRRLWKLRRPRNRMVHGASAAEVEPDELEFACSLLSRALVHRLRDERT